MLIDQRQLSKHDANKSTNLLAALEVLELLYAKDDGALPSAG
jgi:hypothetical protein